MSNRLRRAAKILSFLSVIVTIATADAATETVVYKFGTTGRYPTAGLTLDANGAVYGTTTAGGKTPPEGCDGGCGEVFMITPPAQGQIYHVLYAFHATSSGTPFAGVTIDSTGALFGATESGNGTVFKLMPPPAGSAVWGYKVLYNFLGEANPRAGVILDSSGALYGATAIGGICANCGTIFRLAHPSGKNYWIETPLHSFTGGLDGANPVAGLIMDASGALYGAAALGGVGDGVVFKLSPPAAGETVWTETAVHRFQGGNDGANPYAGLISDANGALYGTTKAGGNGCPSISAGGCGVVFRLNPPTAGKTAWTMTILHRFAGGADGAAPVAGLIRDANGALYGTTSAGGGACPSVNTLGCGTAFSLTPPVAGKTVWRETILHSFTDSFDGQTPVAGLTADTTGTLYGTTEFGGETQICNCGSMFKLTGTGFVPPAPAVRRD